MISQRCIHPNDLRAIWPWIKVGLERVGNKCREDWASEDVWASLRVGGSTLYVYDRDGEDIGFAVMQKQVGIDGPILFTWASWFVPREYYRHRKELLALAEDTARSIGAKEMRHHSSRRGWGYGDHEDWQEHTIIWRRVVAAKEQECQKAAVAAAPKR